MPENCAGCRYWFLMRSSGETRPLGEPSSHRRGLFGTCHRGPPVIVAEWSNPPGMGGLAYDPSKRLVWRMA